MRMPQTSPNEVHTMTLDHTIRNAIGKTLAAGTALYVGICGLPGLAGKEDVQVSQQPPAAEQQVQGSYLEQAANELFQQGVAEAASGDDYDMPPDHKLREYMQPPVETTIGERGIDYIKVDDSNYDDVVFNSDKPVMVLFYNSKSEASTGDAALAKVLDQTFEKDGVKEGYAGDDILFCAYQITDQDAVHDTDLINRLESTYPISDMPAIAFYKHENGEIKHLHSLNGGFSDLETLKNNIDVYLEDIPQYMLD